MSEPILRVKGLRAQIAGQQVVEDVSLEVPSTGVTALLGRNGVGKTSTVKGILGLIERSGEIEFAGERIDREPTHRIVQRGIGYVPEDREVFASLSVAENLRLAERDRAPRRELVAELFPDIHARSAQQAGTLSGGQQQMVSLARALPNDNRLLLVEQNLQVVRRLAATVVVLEAGRVVFAGLAADLLDDEERTMSLLGVHSAEDAA